MSQPGKSKPLVSVVTAAYNRASFLPETIESVLSQSYPNIEYIVLDDGSTDNTREVLERYNGRIRWQSHPNMGETLTVNKGWGMARGDFIVTVNSDDPILPGLIETGVDFMLAHPEVLAAYPDWLMIDSEGKVIREMKAYDYDYLNMIRWNRCLIGPGNFIRRTCFDLAGMRNPQYRLIGDYEYWVRLGLHGPFARIPHTLATWRDHPLTTSLTAKGEAMAEEFIRVMKDFFARRDLPPEVRALEGEATAVSYFKAGEVCFDQKFSLTRRYWRRCLLLSILFHVRMQPNGYPIRWHDFLSRILLPRRLYRILQFCWHGLRRVRRKIPIRRLLGLPPKRLETPNRVSANMEESASG